MKRRVTCWWWLETCLEMMMMMVMMMMMMYANEGDPASVPVYNLSWKTGCQMTSNYRWFLFLFLRKHCTYIYSNFSSFFFWYNYPKWRRRRVRFINLFRFGFVFVVFFCSFTCRSVGLGCLLSFVLTMAL